MKKCALLLLLPLLLASCSGSAVREYESRIAELEEKIYILENTNESYAERAVNAESKLKTANADLQSLKTTYSNEVFGLNNQIDALTEQIDILTKKLDAAEHPSFTPAIPDGMTMGQKNALDSAVRYLEYTAFSYSGLIEQLKYEKYSHADASFAADHCGADWKEQAAAKAKVYLDYSSFSRDRLIEQLEYEGFTHEQAVYGVEQNGY